MREAGTAILIVGFVVLAAVGFGGGFTYAQFTDTETKQVSITAGTWTTTPEETPTSSQPAISFVAFCVADGTNAPASTVDITDAVHDNEGEPYGITYESAVGLSTVVIKGGQTFENFEGGTSDTVYFGNGTTGTADQTPPEACPSGETLVVKFEYDKGSDTFVPEIEAEDLSATESVGVKSVKNTTPKTDNTNGSSGTSTATPTETTVETSSTPSETQVSETPTVTETPTPTATPSPTPTVTETATTASVNGTDQGEDHSTGNESEGSDADA